MQFTYRNPERSTTPSRILDSAASLVVGAWPYAAPVAAISPTPERPIGEVAAYAWRDHYRDLRLALDTIADALRANGWLARVVADDNALVDRAAAVRAGLGWAGKNSNVLLPGRGSWFVLGAVVTNAALPPSVEVVDQCGACRQCIDGCPTGAIVADGVVDARRCLAWLLQADGDFAPEFRKSLGTRLYGCDDCQTVCPPSRDSPTDPLGDEITGYDLLELLTADEEALMAAVGRWYIPKRDPHYVRRNALVALGNSDILPVAQTQTSEVLTAYVRNGEASSADESEQMLARHARWAADELGLDIN